jgi:hypothetical protein
MIAKRILASIAVLGALLGAGAGTAAAASAATTSTAAPATLYHT